MSLSRLVTVWVKTAGGQIPAGEMIFDADTGGRARGAFRYVHSYMESRQAFPLDPIHLPLGSGSLSIEHPGIFGVFVDSLPDDWGRRLLVKRHNLTRHEQDPANLLCKLGADGLGVLAYSPQERPVASGNEAAIRHLAELQTAAEQFERGDEVAADIIMLMGAGSSPGGARPKALVYDDTSGTHYLAKFPSIKDHVDVVTIERATMTLAGNAGLIVPATSLVQCGTKPVFLVERFDIDGPNRRHMISMQTLLDASGYYVLRYEDMLRILRHTSADPAADSSLLFRQMVFNAVIGNTDDHLKNFWMTHDRDNGWRLSPAFDLVPDIGRRGGEHVLLFDTGSFPPGRARLIRQGHAWKVSSPEKIVDEVFSAVAGWREEFSAHGITEADINQFRQIDANLSEK